MPMIEAKVTMQLPAEKRDVLKALTRPFAGFLKSINPA